MSDFERTIVGCFESYMTITYAKGYSDPSAFTAVLAKMDTLDKETNPIYYNLDTARLWQGYSSGFVTGYVVGNRSAVTS